MNQNDSGRAGRPARGYADTTGHSHHHEVLTSEQLQALGQRRKDAEQKLERHQLEARSKESLHETDSNPADPADNSR
ncbi:hypothetical protein [Arthrobacter sp. ISL-28]|uniref:hypothetical protein n=1 Tax=Arthrobacter sp. ISL-28 TaxID=2819108 RepID=UPI001BE6570D|nr:hypothetical protein [Arthrobacter sp. ISL-28]MBT2523276.1 hypothetical protein [Arthrobacter sp. ISL-28]